MRASDAVEKVTKEHPEYLHGHDKELLELARNTSNKELKWHLAQLVPRLDLSPKELESAWHRLQYWASNPIESKIVRANALEGLFELHLKESNPALTSRFNKTLFAMERERIPSLAARARVLRRRLNKDRAAIGRVRPK
jgi:hypothetical protein